MFESQFDLGRRVTSVIRLIDCGKTDDIILPQDGPEWVGPGAN